MKIYNAKIGDLAKFIQPIITKCRPSDEEVDIELIRNNFMEILI